MLAYHSIPAFVLFKGVFIDGHSTLNSIEFHVSPFVSHIPAQIYLPSLTQYNLITEPTLLDFIVFLLSDAMHGRQDSLSLRCE